MCVQNKASDDAPNVCSKINDPNELLTALGI